MEAATVGGAADAIAVVNALAAGFKALNPGVHRRGA
jgi:hypothetical protein